MQIPINISHGRKSLMGMLHVPYKRDLVTPVVIMCYGMNGDRVESHRMAYLLGHYAEKYGIILLRLDYYGLGISNGEYVETSLESKVEDILIAIEFLKGCLKYEMHSIVLIGFSDGAKVATRVADIVGVSNSICLWNPVFCDYSAIENDETTNKQKPIMTRDPFCKKLAYSLPYTGLLMNVQYLREISCDSFDINNFLETSSRKVLIFGSEDSKTKILQKMLCNRNFDEEDNSTLITIQGADHLFSNSKWSYQVIQLTIEWILKECQYEYK